MTPIYGREMSFLAPPSQQDAEQAGREQPMIDHRAEAMRALRHPFAIRAEATGASLR